MERISSRHNPLVRRFREIARGGPAQQWMVLDGLHLVNEAMRSGITLDVVAASDRLADGPFRTTIAGARRAGVTVIGVADQVLAAMSPVRQPSGVVGIAKRPAAALEQVFTRAPQLVVVLSEIQDPGNVGAIVRAAEACGATGVVTTDGTADPFGWKALRGAMGSAFRVPIAAKQALLSTIEHARTSGLRVIATVPRAGAPLPECDLRGPVAILLGGEGGGLADAASAAADGRLTIPMQPPVESLNVAIAAALILYEASRQRSHAPHVAVR